MNFYILNDAPLRRSKGERGLENVHVARSIGRHRKLDGKCYCRYHTGMSAFVFFIIAMITFLKNYKNGESVLGGGDCNEHDGFCAALPLIVKHNAGSRLVLEVFVWLGYQLIVSMDLFWSIYRTKKEKIFGSINQTLNLSI